MASDINTQCFTLTAIDGNDCIGDSRRVINNNTQKIGNSICTLSAITTNLSASTNYLLNVVIPVTGGNIVIPVGSTRQYTNLYTAYQSISGLLFNETANVTFQLDPEEINEPFNIDLTHRSSNVITISGVTQDWQSTQHPDMNGTPIISVAGLSTTRLSATITFDGNYNIPSVGDFININSLSGRHVTPFINFDGLSGNDIYISYTTSIPNNIQPNSALERPIQVGDRVLITYFGSGTTVNVRTVSGFTTKNVVRGSGAPSNTSSAVITLQETTGFRFNEYIHQGITIQVGTPSSFRSGCNITQALDSTTLTFSDGVATNTWLNPGDVIYTCGQARIVQSVSSGPTCVINIPFRVSIPTGFQQSLTNAPFLVKTHFERYRGVHKVVAVNGNNVTVEIMDYGFKTFDPIQTPNPPVPGNTNYFDKGHNQVPLPRFGIHSIGAPSTVYKAPTRDKILKTKLNYSNCTFINNNACLYLLGDLKLIDSFCIVCEKTNPSVGISVGHTGLQQKTASINIGSSNGAIGIYGFFSTALAAFDNTVTNGQNISFTQVYTQFAQEVGIQFLPFPNLEKLTNPTNTDPSFLYPFKNSFSIDSSNNSSKAWTFYSTPNATGKITFVNLRDVFGGYSSNIKTSNLTVTGCYRFNLAFKTRSEYVYVSENCNSYNGSSWRNIIHGEAHVLRDSDGAGWYGLSIAELTKCLCIYRTCFIAGAAENIYTSFLDMQNTVLLYVYSDTYMPYCHITGGGTLQYWQSTPFIFPSLAYMPGGGGINLLYPSELTFKTVYESGDNPVNMWYFIPSIVNFNSGTNKFILQDASYIYNCNYGAGLLAESATQLTLDVQRASLFNCGAITTRGLSNPATVIGTGFDTTLGRFINY